MAVDPEGPQWMYHTSCPEGRIFTGSAAVIAAIQQGWWESPAELPPTSAEVDDPDPIVAPPRRSRRASRRSPFSPEVTD